jgi:hypothetical protein
LHIEAYHSQINNRKKSSALKPQKISKIKGKSKGKTVILFKEKKGNVSISSTQWTHGKIEGLK